MSWVDGTDNRKRNARIAKKVRKYRATKKNVTLLLGQALWYPALTKGQALAIKRRARATLAMKHVRLIFTHLAVHKRYNYDTVKLRIRKPNDKPIPDVYTAIYSKLVARKDVEFWKTQLDVFEVVENVRVVNHP